MARASAPHESDTPFVETTAVAAVEAVFGTTRRDVALVSEESPTPDTTQMPPEAKETEEEKSHGTFSSYCTNSTCRTVGAGAL
jgi:hypothetical protein